MCAIDDLEPWDVYGDSRPTARKEHGCIECDRTIRKGEKYFRAEGCIDGTWLTYKLCQHCDSLSGFMMTLCNGWPFGDLYDELVEHWREGYASIPLGRLIVSMRLKWHDGSDPVPERCGDIARVLMQKAVA